ncbi:MAG TPA: hypothetical protein VK082_07335 [Paenalcaligenes sp.]|nr:hypothetical protein [Paenalcaligenes sp.]
MSDSSKAGFVEGEWLIAMQGWIQLCEYDREVSGTAKALAEQLKEISAALGDVPHCNYPLK